MVTRMDKQDLFVIYGRDARRMTLDLLEQIRPEVGLAKTARIGIKPNLVVAKPAETGATTHPELVAGILAYFQGKGFDNLVILEGSWVGDQTSRAFRTCGYEDLARRFRVPLIDLQRDTDRMCSGGGMQIAVCEQVLQLDYLVNVPVLKGHCQTGMTCALKNLKGCIPNREKRRFHSLGLHRPIAALNAIVRQDLILVDGLCGDLNFEEGGHPVAMNRIIAARDPVLADSFVASLMGFSNDEIEYIGFAEAMGVGSADLSRARITALNDDLGTSKLPMIRSLGTLTRLIADLDACSACYGSLVHALERLREHGTLGTIRQPLRIGQRYKGQSCDGIGIGSCTAGCARHLPGCPPDARSIVRFLENLPD